jgi:hypothetical protein
MLQKSTLLQTQYFAKEIFVVTKTFRLLQESLDLHVDEISV